MRWMYTTSLILSRFLPLFHNPISNWKKKERKKKESNNSTRLSKCEEPQFSLFIPSSKGKKEKSDAPKTVDGREHGVKQIQTTAPVFYLRDSNSFTASSFSDCVLSG